MEKKQKIYDECLERMKILNLSYNCINAFKRGTIWESEGIGALYEINDKEKQIVKEFEEEHKDYKVYHLIHNIYKEIGEVYTILFVSTYEEEWETEKQELKENIAFAYCKNIECDWCSEFGSVGIKRNIGGLIRTY